VLELPVTTVMRGSASGSGSGVSSSAPASTARKVVNFVAFQCGWLACVVGAANGYAWQGVIAAVLIVSAHVITAARPAVEARLVALALLLGVIWEWSLLATGVLGYAAGAGAGAGVAGLPPLWILALWPLFASTLNTSLAWLQGRWLLAAILGAVSGPAAYWAGARLGALSFTDPLVFVAALAVGWAILTPALLAIAARLDAAPRVDRS